MQKWRLGKLCSAVHLQSGAKHRREKLVRDKSGECKALQRRNRRQHPIYQSNSTSDLARPLLDDDLLGLLKFGGQPLYFLRSCQPSLPTPVRTLNFWPTMSTEKAGDHGSISTDSSPIGETSTKRQPGFLGALRTFEAKLDKKFGIESDAISRKLPEEKGYVPWHYQMNMFFLWASGTMNMSCFATGFLGWEFGLSKSPCFIREVRFE